MRPLHRPMFRYGGPIKEGVMSGIKEPQAKHTVGSSVWPQTDGRTHQSKIGTGGKILSKVPGGSKIVSKISSSTKDLFPRIGQWWRNIKPTAVPSRVKTNVGMGGVQLTPAQIKAGMGTKGIPFAERAGRWVRKNPWWTAGGVGVGSQYAGDTAKTVAGLAEKIPLQMADLLVRDKYFDQDKWMKENYPEGFIGSLFSGKDKKEDEKKLTANELRIQQLEKLLAGKEEPTVPQKSDAEIRKEQIQKYRDIMDIKGMNKRAAYDSLIDASKLVSESGDFKGDIRSGKLINEVIQATSKQFDKPSKTKDAIDTLILKGEIEKDIKSSMPTEAEKTAAAFGISKDEYKKKLLGKTSAAEIIANISTKTGRVDSTTVASGYKASGIVPKATITDTIVDEWIDNNKGKTEIDYVKDVISKEPDFVPGIYVVGDRAVITDGTNFQYDY